MTANERFLLTSDRDEKIRISNFPNSYNIETYLLKHKEFVSQIQLINDERLVSGSGDSNLILWDLNDFKCIQEIDTRALYNSDDYPKNLNGIQKFDFNQSESTLLVHIFQADFLLCFKFSENKLDFIQKIDFAKTIDFFVPILDKFYLFVYFNLDSSVSYEVKKLDQQSFVELNINNQYENNLKLLETCLVEKLVLENVDQVKNELEKDFLSFFKTKANNMQYYYERKQERIKSTANNGNSINKRKRSTSPNKIETTEKKMIK